MIAAAAAASIFAAQSVWEISDARTLVWGGKPYLPIGVRIPGTPEAIAGAAAAGLTDVAIDLPVDGKGWTEAVAALEKANLRYFIAIATPPPALEGWIVDPVSYRKSPIVDAQSFQWPLPRVNEAFALTVSRREGTMRWSDRIICRDGVLNVSVDPKGLDQALLIYPHTQRAAIPDYWERWDAQRDQLLRSLKQSNLGQGFRGLIDPAGAAKEFPGDKTNVVPDSQLFRLELQQLLAVRYKTPADAVKAWALSANDITTFQRLARMVPLWNGNRGAGAVLDPDTSRTYVADPMRSKAWSDIRDTMVEAMHRRTNRLAAAIQSVSNVPMLQDFAGWSGPYERSSTGMVGIGAAGSLAAGENPARLFSHPAGSLSDWIRPGFLAGTDITLASPDALPSQVVSQTSSMGVRAWFFRLNQQDYPKAVDAQKLAESLTAEAGRKVEYIPYPVSAEGLCTSRRLPGGRWWVPAAGKGDRIFGGRVLDGYRFEGQNQKFVAFWSKGSPIRTRFRASDPRAIAIEPLDGVSGQPGYKGKNLMDVTLGSDPVLFKNVEELPAPLDAFTELGGGVKTLFATYEAKAQGGGTTENDFAEALRLFDEQPGPSYLRVADILLAAAPRVSNYLLVEAEQLTSTFSDVQSADGLSGKKALSMISNLPGTSGQASFGVSPRRIGPHSLWVAAKLPPSNPGSLTVTVGTKTLTVEGPSIQTYGPGFAWYQLGSVEIGQGGARVTVNASPPLGEELAIDALVFTPDAFTPNGPYPPVDWVFSLPKPQGLPRTGLDVGPSRPPKAAVSPPSGSHQAR